jgi:hypothetical protein
MAAAHALRHARACDEDWQGSAEAGKAAGQYLLGDVAWWLPRWLDRLLPDVDVDGEKLTAMRIPDDPREVYDDRQPVARGTRDAD